MTGYRDARTARRVRWSKQGAAALAEGRAWVATVDMANATDNDTADAVILIMYCGMPRQEWPLPIVPGMSRRPSRR